MPKIAVPFVIFFTTLLLVIACFLGVFGLKNSGSSIYYNLPYDNIGIVALPYERVDSTFNVRSYEFFKTDNSIYIDKVLVNYGIELVSTNNLMSNLFSTDFKYTYFCIVYDISSYKFLTQSDIIDYLQTNQIILDDSNFYKGYILPYLLSSYLTSADVDYSVWNVDNILQRGDIVPYYEVDGIGTSTFLYISDNVFNVVIDNTMVGTWSLPIRASAYDYFKGVVGSFGLSSLSARFPRFDYEIDNFIDFLGVFEYVFTYLGRVAEFLQITLSNLFYGFVPVFTIYGV